MMSSTSMGTGRRDARERAVQLVYEAVQRDLAPESIIAEQIIEPDEYTTTLVSGSLDNRSSYDGRISEKSREWPTKRQPLMDRVIMWIAIFELSERPEIPTGVVLSEAVELAQSYSTDDSNRFVNGVLSAIATDLRP